MDSAAEPSNPIKLAKLFGNLSVLPLHGVHSHLDAASLVLVSLASENWEPHVKKDRRQFESSWDIDITEDEVRVQLNFEKNRKMDFGLCFKEDSSMTEEFKVEHDQESNLITCYYQTASQLEPSCFKVLRLVSELFLPASFNPSNSGVWEADIAYGHIILSLGSRSPDFPFRLLSKLPRGSTEHVVLQGDLEVDFGDFLQFFRNVFVWKSYNRTYDIGVRFKNLMMSDENVISNKMKIADVRFMTRESLLKLNVRRAEIGENNFTSQDFNALFRSWTEVETNSNLIRITFAIREDQMITMEEVTEGLNPYVGKPRIRDRWHLDYPNSTITYMYPTGIDCDKGWDIRNFENDIGIILLEANRLTFCTIPDRHRFRRDRFMNDFETNTRTTLSALKDAKRKYKRVQGEILRKGENASRRLLKLLDSCTEEIARCEKRLVGLRETLEMMRLWTND